MRLITIVFLVLTLGGGAAAASAAEVSSTALTLDPTYDAGGCALVSGNGYGGTDRQLFIPTVDAYYTVKDYSSNATQALITVEAFDPNQRLLDQAFFLGYAARSAGMDCPNGLARKPFFQGFDSAQSAYWNITCGNEAYTVMLENDAQGSSSAMPCSVLKSIGIVCYTKLD